MVRAPASHAGGQWFKSTTAHHSKRYFNFRRGFCVHNVKSGLSNKVVQSPGGWETPNMVSHYAASLTFEDALKLYKDIMAISV